MACNEFGEAVRASLDEVVDGAKGGEEQVAKFGFRDEIPESIAPRHWIGGTFQIGTIKELHDRLADLAAARHVAGV